MQIILKTKAIIAPYIQVLFVLIAFALMISLSYAFMRNIETKNMRREAHTALSNMQIQLQRNLSRPEMVIKKAVHMINSMMEQGENIDKIKEHAINNYEYWGPSQNITKAFVIFDESSADSIWYKAAVEANGEIAIVEHFDKSLKKYIVAYVCRIFNKAGNPQGFIGLNINADDIVDNTIDVQIAGDGFGFVLNRNIELVAHPLTEHIGKSLKEANIGISDFIPYFEQGAEASEYKLVNYKNQKAVVFFKQMKNGWSSGIVTSQDNYYKSVKQVARYLTALGVTFSLIISLILIRITNAKEHMNILVRNKNQELERMAHWYKSILNAVPLPITVTDKNTNWTFINTATEKYLGIKCEDALGKPCSNWNANICKTPNCGIERAKRGMKQTFFQYKEFSFKVDIEILKNKENNETMGYIEVVQDITEVERMAKAEAEHANNAKSAFLAKMSHEIRTPMNSIMGITEIQLQNKNLAPELKEAFIMIYNSGNLLLGIINNILDLSKIEAEKMELVLAEYEIASLINDVAQLNIMRNKNENIKFGLQIDENIPVKLIGDEVRVKQILNNLISNAFKYTKQGKIEFSIFVKKDKENNVILVFRVSDTGQGMTAEQVNKLFSAEFTRFNLKSNRFIEGSGLGLIITHHLVQMMGGEISVDSVFNKGSVFTVNLPQKIADSNVLGKEQVENLCRFRVSSLAQTNIIPIVYKQMPYGSVLIVDDVASNVFVAKGMMQPYGLSIDTASSGFEAIEKIKSGNVYSIVFMDHMMPEMDGMETTKIIRELGYTHPIVALTANAMVGQTEIFLNSGFDGFISKPINIRLLDAELKKFIRNKQTPSSAVEEKEKVKEVEEAKPANALHKAKVDAELLSMFVMDTKRVLPIFEAMSANVDTMTDEDYKLYAITAHGIKSALANIGETVLSQIAFTLEKAGKEQNKGIIKSRTQDLISALKEIIAENTEV